MEITIKIISYEAKMLDELAKKIHALAINEGSKVSGPIPMPTKRELFTILKSVHVNKKSREQFELKTHKRLLKLSNVNNKLNETLKHLKIPNGVSISIKIK